MKGKIDMRSKILTALVATLLPLSAVAQDDMYFVPTKAQVKAEKEARQKDREAKEEAQQKRLIAERKAYMEQNRAEWNMEQIQIGKLEDKENALAAQQSTYYSGINKSVDEYNRHYSASRNDTTVFSKDSIASDIIDFTQGNGYPQEVARVDTVYKYVFLDDDDYRYSRWMSRWDNYFWHGNFWGPWGWMSGWYGPYYDPFFNPWFDPWFYGPWYSPYWAYYDPWFYGSVWGWSSWYGPNYYNPGWYSPGIAVGHSYSYSPGFGPHNDAQRHDSHFYANHRSSSVYNSPTYASTGSRSNSNYNIAQRNGGVTSRTSGRSFNDSSTGWSHRTFRSESGYRTNSDIINSRSYGGFSGGSHSSGGYSGGGYSGGGASGGGGGGGFSGAGHGGGGGHR